MQYVKIDSNDLEQKKRDEKQKEICSKCDGDCSKCSIYLYGTVWRI